MEVAFVICFSMRFVVIGSLDLHQVEASVAPDRRVENRERQPPAFDIGADFQAELLPLRKLDCDGIAAPPVDRGDEAMPPARRVDIN